MSELCSTESKKKSMKGFTPDCSQRYKSHKIENAVILCEKWRKSKSFVWVAVSYYIHRLIRLPMSHFSAIYIIQDCSGESISTCGIVSILSWSKTQITQPTRKCSDLSNDLLKLSLAFSNISSRLKILSKLESSVDESVVILNSKLLLQSFSNALR